MMKTITKLSSIFVGTLMILAALSPAFAFSSVVTAQEMNTASINGQNSVGSYNWGGYAVTASSVTSVSGSWVVPTMSAGTSKATTYYSAFWVGIDGYSSSTVEQTGILAETTGSTTTYLAWYEFYPSPMYEIVQTTTVNHRTVTVPAPVAAGDVITASVTYTGTSSGLGSGSQNSMFGSTSSTILDDTSGAFNSPTFASTNPSNALSRSTSEFIVTITDVTAKWAYSTTGTVSNAARSSAEWIVESPSVNGQIASLANFGTVSFSSCSAATASGSISLSSSAVYAITIVADNKAETAMATPSALTLSTPYVGSFTDTWVSAGP